MNASRPGAVSAACAVLALSACATLPPGPSLPALPGSQRTPDQFAADDSRCRAWVNERLAGRSAADAANQTVASSAAAGTAIGAVTGAAIDGSSGAAAGAGLGLLFGALAGSGASQGAWAASQQQYDSVYHACMYALGHKVPVPAHDAARYRAWLDSTLPRSVPPPDYRPPPSPAAAPAR